MKLSGKSVFLHVKRLTLYFQENIIVVLFKFFGGVEHRNEYDKDVVKKCKAVQKAVPHHAVFYGVGSIL